MNASTTAVKYKNYRYWTILPAVMTIAVFGQITNASVTIMRWDKIQEKQSRPHMRLIQTNQSSANLDSNTFRTQRKKFKRPRPWCGNDIYYTDPERYRYMRKLARYNSRHRIDSSNAAIRRPNHRTDNSNRTIPTKRSRNITTPTKRSTRISGTTNKTASSRRRSEPRRKNATRSSPRSNTTPMRFTSF